MNHEVISHYGNMLIVRQWVGDNHCEQWVDVRARHSEITEWLTGIDEQFAMYNFNTGEIATCDDFRTVYEYALETIRYEVYKGYRKPDEYIAIYRKNFDTHDLRYLVNLNAIAINY